MTDETIYIEDLPEWDASEFLDNEDIIRKYLADAATENNPELLALALENVARARGMTEIARLSGIDRKALYDMLQKGAVGQFEALSNVSRAVMKNLPAGKQPVAA
jgi:probable addiction module antidote protein